MGMEYIIFVTLPDELKILFEKCGFEKNLVAGCINFGIYWRFGDNKLLNIFLFPVMIFDIFISKFKFSSKIGEFLICIGTKR